MNVKSTQGSAGVMPVKTVRYCIPADVQMDTSSMQTAGSVKVGE